MSTKGCVFGRYSLARVDAVRLARWGDEVDLARRFWANVQVEEDPASCWRWTGHVGQHGYGVQGQVLAHRRVYQWAHGAIPTGLVIDHLCRNRRCVNPAHLEAVTQRENVRRSSLRDSHCRNGHERTADNTYHWREKRHCLTCSRDRRRRRTVREREARQALQ